MEPRDEAGTVLVAGGTGFVGSAIVRRLHQRGRPVAVLSRSPERAAGRFAGMRVELRRADVTRPETLAPALDGIDTLVQTIQFPGYPVEDRARGRTFLEVDAKGTQAMVAAARSSGVRKIVYLSGVGADRESPKVWFRAKGLAEAAVRGSGLTWAIVRPSWAYGPGDASLNRFVSVIRLVPGFFPQIGSGRQALTPIFIDDLSALAADVTVGSDADGVILEAGGPEVLTLDEVIRATMRAVGRRKPIVHVPLALVGLAAAVLEALPGQLLSRDAVEFITQSAVADTGALGRHFPSWAPRSLEQALAIYL